MRKMVYQYDYPHPAVTVDACVFCRVDCHVQVLLVRRRSSPFEGCWALPGGFVDIDEDLDVAVARELEEETGLDSVLLEQVQAFGAVERDPRERVISVAYVGVVEGCPEVRAGGDAADARWFPVERLPETAFDHDLIIATARARLPASG